MRFSFAARQALKLHMRTQPAPQRHGGRSAQPRARRYIGDDAGLRGDLRPCANLEVSSNTGLTTCGDKISKLGRTGNADLRDNQTSPSDRHIMGDLHKIIDFGAFSNHGIARRSAVDRGVGADLDIVLNNDTADLRNFEMALAARHKAETILADPYAWMKDDTIANQGMNNRYLRTDRTLAAKAYIRTDNSIGPYGCPSANLRPRPNDSTGIDDQAARPDGSTHLG